MTLECVTPGDARIETDSRYVGLDLHLVDTQPLMEAVFRQRYRAYQAEAVIDPTDSERFIDAYDLNRTSLLFAVVEQGEVVGSIRFAVQPPIGAGIGAYCSSPEFTVFADILETLLSDDRTIVSGSRFAIAPDHPRRSEIALLLTLAVLRGGRGCRAKWGIATARGSHLFYYRRILGMDPVGESRPMPGLNRSYSLLVGEVRQTWKTAQARFPKACWDHFDALKPKWECEINQALPTTLLRAG